MWLRRSASNQLRDHRWSCGLPSTPDPEEALVVQQMCANSLEIVIRTLALHAADCVDGDDGYGGLLCEDEGSKEHDI